MNERNKAYFNRFSEKNSHLGKWVILGPKMAHPNNSGSGLRMFFKFCTMKGANRLMKNNFFKKTFVGKWAILDPKMAHPHNYGSTLRIF